MKKPNPSHKTLHIILVVWLIISATYIVHDLWKNGLSATYQAGYQQAFGDVIANSQQCKPFNVFVGEAKVDLINVACLEQAAAQAEAAQKEAMMEKDGEAMEKDES